MTHNMRLRREPFEKIKSGEKTVELRLYDEKRRAISVGDEVFFACVDGDDTPLQRRVTALHVFASFAELYSALPLEKCGYSAEEIESASPEDMNAYYPREEQAKFGVVGIELALCEN